MNLDESGPVKRRGDTNGLQPEIKTVTSEVNINDLQNLKKIRTHQENGSNGLPLTLTGSAHKTGSLRPSPTSRTSATHEAQQGTETSSVGMSVTSKLRNAGGFSSADVHIDTKIFYDDAAVTLRKNLITPEGVKDKIKSLMSSLQNGSNPVNGPGLETSVRAAIARVAHEGNIGQLNNIRTVLTDNGITQLYSPKTGSLSDVYLYLNGEGKRVFGNAVKDRNITGVSESELNKDTAVILDRPTIKKLQTDGLFRERVLASQAKLVVPATIENLNPLSGSTLNSHEDIVLATARKFADKQPKKITPNELHNYFEKLSLQSLDTKLSSCGINVSELKQQGRIVFARPKSIKSCNDEGIALAYNQGADLKGEKVKELLTASAKKRQHLLTDKSHELLARYISHNADVYPTSRLAEASVTQRDFVEKFAQEHHIDLEDTVFLVPDARKSYGIVAAIFQEKNPDFCRFITPDQLLSSNFPPKLVVVLDDVAGSGKSLDDVRRDIRTNGYQGPLLISPVVASTACIRTPGRLKSDQSARDDDRKKFAGFEDRQKNDANFHFKPVHEIDGLFDSQFYFSLSEANKVQLKTDLGDLGYGEQGLLIIFPYMTPNNNARIIAGAIGPEFTLNQKGVKDIQNLGKIDKKTEA